MKLQTVIGILFLIFAAILVALGIVQEVAPGRLNLNLYTGLVMGGFASVMLKLGRDSKGTH